MANNEWPDSRFLFSDMFSFSFEPEVLTFLWGICTRKADDIQRDYRYLFPTSSLLKVFVPFEGQRTNFLTFLKTTVITGGTLVGVGFSSYGTFKLLQKLRYQGFGGVKGYLTNLTSYWKTPELITSNSLELVLRRGHTNGGINPTSDLPKRPSDLSLNSSHSNGNGYGACPSPLNMHPYRLIGNNTVPMDHFSVSPINGDIASGDEDGAEVQGQYFGPPTDNLVTTPSKPKNSLIVAVSPEDELRDKYELLRKQSTPYLPNEVKIVPSESSTDS